MDRRQQLGAGVVVAGLAIALAGVAGLAGAFGGRPPGSAPAASLVAATSVPTTIATPAATTPGPTAQPTVAATVTPTARPSQLPNVLGGVAMFVQDLADAYHAGTVSALAPRLHPAVIARYGEAACRASLAAIQPDPTYAVTVRSIGPLASWDWISDGRSTVVPDTVTVGVNLVRAGERSSAEFHFAFVDGQLRWFSDCGTPVS